jgi:hypothetical protein
MLNVLMILGTPKKLFQLISVNIAGSKATVRVDNQYTSTFPITKGVRQGGALSSILFDLVLEAILQKINTTGHIGTRSVQILAYADYVVIVGRNKNALKDTLVNIENETRKRGLRINENKTKYMEVKTAASNSDNLRCEKYVFEHVKEFIYLGSQLNQTKSTSSEIQARILSGNRYYYAYRKLTFSVRHLNAIKSTAGRSFLGIKPLPALQQM